MVAKTPGGEEAEAVAKKRVNGENIAENSVRGHSMKAILHGTVHGKRIDLDQELGLAEGEMVTVTVETRPSLISPTTPEAFEALKRAAGGWSDDPEGLEEFLKWNRDQRKKSRPEISG